MSEGILCLGNANLELFRYMLYNHIVLLQVKLDRIFNSFYPLTKYFGWMSLQTSDYFLFCCFQQKLTAQYCLAC